jgi:hypothetical protein
MSPRDFLSQLQRSLRVNSVPSREALEVREQFRRFESENIQSRLWTWVGDQPEGCPSTFQLLRSRNAATTIPPILRNPTKSEVGLLIIGSNTFALNYLPNEDSWSNFRTHFLLSYFSSHQSSNEVDEAPATSPPAPLALPPPPPPVDLLEIADTLVASLRELILSSEEPVVTMNEDYRVNFFTDGSFKAWALQQRQSEEFQYVAVHGVSKKMSG